MSDFSKLFASSDEELVAVLGNSTAQRFLATGELGNGFIVLSNKRIYFHGKCLLRTGRRFMHIREERVVDVLNVTGTGFVHIRHVWMRVISILCGIACLCGMITCATEHDDAVAVAFTLGGAALVALFEYLYAASKTSIFEIAFAGGGIGVDIRWFYASDVDAFQKRIKQISDEQKRREAMQAHGTSTASELSKLAELLEKGLISPEEFEEQKRKLL